MILKNFCFSAIPDIKKICDDYFTYLNLHYFGHITVYPDGKFHFLCSKYDWPDYGFAKEEIPPGGFTIYDKIKDSIIFPHKKSGIDLGWSEKVMKDSNEQFGIQNLMVIFRKYSDHYEGFFFDVHDEKPYEKYLNNFDLFENFVFYYKDKAKDLLTKASKNQLQVHEKYLQESYINAKSILDLYSHTPDLNKQNKNLIPKQYFLMNDGKNYPISTREYECLSLASHGKKLKDIANSLDLSYRTVETHLNGLKQKLNVKTLSAAIDIYWKNRILVGK